MNEYGEEFWYARELQTALEYKEWRNFYQVMNRAVIACENSENEVAEHFVEVNKTICMPKGATKEISDYELSRYACYLIVQNGDSRKKGNCIRSDLFCCEIKEKTQKGYYEISFAFSLK